MKRKEITQIAQRLVNGETEVLMHGALLHLGNGTVPYISLGRAQKPCACVYGSFHPIGRSYPQFVLHNRCHADQTITLDKEKLLSFVETNVLLFDVNMHSIERDVRKYRCVHYYPEDSSVFEHFCKDLPHIILS